MDEIHVTQTIKVPLSEIDLTAIRSSGPGGQHVNTSSTAIQLRFDIPNSSLPWRIKNKLLSLSDSRLTQNGEIVIKSQEHRSQARNKEAAIARLKSLLIEVSQPEKRRIPTRPSRRAQTKRVDKKVHRGKIKSLRGRVKYDS